MAKNWTEAQRSAIETRDRTLLVSAAAGSGKTATLTERIIRSLLDGENPGSITEMLIVTFTNAAVAELKERIGKAVAEALAADPTNIRLERELLMLPVAKIRTIDSYCGELLRANAERVGVSPGYRIADTGEAELLAENLLDGMISAVYDGELPEIATPEEFDELCDCLTDMKNQSGIIDSLRFVYGKAMNTEEGIASLRTAVEEYNLEGKSLDGSRYADYAVSRLKGMAGHYKRIFERLREEFISYGKKGLKHVTVIESDLALLGRISAAKGYTQLFEIMRDAEHLDSPGAKADPAASPLTAIRSAYKSEKQKLKANFFTYSESEWRAASGELYRLLSVLCRFLEGFDKAFLAEKLRRGALEYSDVERFAYQCLWQNGEKTDIALEQAKMYTSVYIDEYQDVNTLQAKIFDAIIDGNGFMVGDIKQSIYGFRNANPEMFSEKKRSYPELKSSLAGGNAAVFMSQNFRCDKGVVDFVNSVFDRLFPLFGESLSYTEEDSLGYAKQHEGGEPPYRAPEICAVFTPSKAQLAEGAEPEEWELDQPSVVARKIKTLLETGRLNNGEPIRPKDIAILCRSATNDKDYAAALSALGIPCAVADEMSFFTNPEVLLTLSLLYSIDNPRRDSQLAGLMCSPLFSFTPDELALISGEGRGEYLYDRLKDYVKSHPDFEKGRSFISRLEYYRILSEGMAVDRLLARLYGESGLFALASRSGGGDRLVRFYDYARRFEGSSFKGLYNFISYVNKITDKKKNAFDVKEAPTVTDAVRIQTVHSSKGLEYPVVILAEAQSYFDNGREAASRLSYSEKFGIGMLLRTPSGLSRVNNPMKRAVADYMARRELEEETRILYVALTRARERLYVVGKPRKGEASLLSSAALAGELLSSDSVYSLPSSLELILACTGHTPVSVRDFVRPEECDLAVENAKALKEKPSTEQRTEQTETVEGLKELFSRRFAYKYEREHLTTLPEKMSVSRLYPTVLDGADDNTSLLFDADIEAFEAEGKETLPEFLSGCDRREAAKKGIATHLLLQFCDFGLLDKLGAEAELKRLKELKFISKEDAERVRLSEVEAFRSSSLMREIREAKELHRELRFNVTLPASRFTAEEEKQAAYKDERVLVQGVIDCLYEDAEGELHLVDYKTDRLTREERENPAKGEARLRESHSLQLSYYAEAVKEIFGKEPKTVSVYSLHLGKAVRI